MGNRERLFYGLLLYSGLAAFISCKIWPGIQFSAEESTGLAFFKVHSVFPYYEIQFLVLSETS